MPTLYGTRTGGDMSTQGFRRIGLAILAVTLAGATAFGTQSLPVSPVAADTPEFTATFSINKDWTTGFDGEVTIANNSGRSLPSWKVEWDMPADSEVKSAWDTTMTKAGTHYVFDSQTWAAPLASGSTAKFGLTGTKTATFPGPQNCVLNGFPCTGAVDKAPPAAITGLKAARVTPTTVTLTWPAATDDVGVTGYDVYQGETKVQSTTGLLSTVTGLARKTGYEFTVLARDRAGKSSARSNVVAVTTPDGEDVPGNPFALRVAPFVDMGAFPTPSLTAIAHDTGLRAFTLAFLTSNACKVNWFGAYDPDQGWQKEEIDALRSMGGEINVSFGGLAGTELAQSCTDVNAIAQEYTDVVKAYGLKYIDFDIEGAAVPDKVSVDRRSQALVKVQKDNPGLQISLTLPVMPYGLTAEGNYILASAKQYGVNIALVNGMTMDFNQGVDKMGEKTTQAAQALHDQIKAVWTDKADTQLWGMVGVTPMIGENDDKSIFTLDDAKLVTDYANAHHLGLLAFWELTRDRNACKGQLFKCTNIDQQAFDFTKRFLNFYG
ncbi:hypothetical protein D5S17_12685 [Pseudonocardiaceae bacterium YIM PH 21723]|nr:hypothetical protein D5S17_12685 [Pseudonocardiaceae bacterium YIM PH 21723]